VETIKRNSEALLETSREVSIEVNTEKAENIFVSHNQKGGQNHSTLITNKSLKNVCKVQMFGNNEALKRGSKGKTAEGRKRTWRERRKIKKEEGSK
jgi:hypothetical protein